MEQSFYSVTSSMHELQLNQSSIQQSTQPQKISLNLIISTIDLFLIPYNNHKQSRFSNSLDFFTKISSLPQDCWTVEDYDLFGKWMDCDFQRFKFENIALDFAKNGADINFDLSINNFSWQEWLKNGNSLLFLKTLFLDIERENSFFPSETYNNILQFTAAIPNYYSNISYPLTPSSLKVPYLAMKNVVVDLVDEVNQSPVIRAKVDSEKNINIDILPFYLHLDFGFLERMNQLIGIFHSDSENSNPHHVTRMWFFKFIFIT